MLDEILRVLLQSHRNVLFFVPSFSPDCLMVLPKATDYEGGYTAGIRWPTWD